MQQQPTSRFSPCVLWPSLLLPFGFALWWIFTGSIVAIWSLVVWANIQIVYVIYIERKRRSPDLTPVQTLEFGPRSAEKCAVLVHGFADIPEAWRRQGEALATRGWRVIVPEISLTATANEWLPYIRAAILEARTTAQHVELWGHSLGGALAITVAQDTPVDRLVLCAPFLEPHMGNSMASFLCGLHRLIFLWPFAATGFPIDRYVKGAPTAHYRVQPIVPARTFLSALRAPKAALRKPTLVRPIILLSQREHIVRNDIVRRTFPNAHYLLAANPRSCHSLTNAVDWLENLITILNVSDEVCHPL